MLLLLTAVLLLSAVAGLAAAAPALPPSSLSLSLSSAAAAAAAVQGRDALDTLIDYCLAESNALERLAEMTDRFGPRLSGSVALEESIDWVVSKMLEDNITTVYTEDVLVPHWVRGNEYAELVEPRAMSLAMMGMGMSIGTGPDGITSEIIVVKSIQELRNRSSEVPGKMVVYNPPWIAYAYNRLLRRKGAVEAAALGATAALLRSVSPYSLATPHTGDSDTSTIPFAAITHEDADMLERMVARGTRVVVKLYMEAQQLPDAVSRNIIAEVPGTELPNELVVMGGHIDSWDVGAGVIDDAGGAFVAWDALRLMVKYDIRPRRTVRVVFWTNEENGARGADQYRANRVAEIPRTSFALESDAGIFSPIGIGLTSVREAYDEVAAIGERYLARIDAGAVRRGGGGVDILPLCLAGIPCAGLRVSNGAREDKTDSYYYYHHTAADSITHLRQDEVAKCTASMAAWSYGIADLPELLPRLRDVIPVVELEDETLESEPTSS